MTTKEQVLELLLTKGKTYISGEEIAEKLFVTRAAVWKAIKALQADGYSIEAVRNRGYYLQIEEEILNDMAIIKQVKADYASKIKVCTFEEVESTNDLARVKSFDNPENEYLFVSDYQTKGRGRRGRAFLSPKGTGLYLSFLLRPKMGIEEATKLTCMSAVAVARAIEKVTGIHVDIKWVNDLYLKDKKLCGILTEAVTSIEDNSLSYVIVGIGINLFPPKEGFSPEIRDIATALYVDSKGPENLKNSLTAEIINNFYDLYENGQRNYIDEYKSRSNLIGHYVKINNFSETKTARNYGLVTGIDDECRLIVEYEDKSTEALSSGEVSVVKY